MVVGQRPAHDRAGREVDQGSTSTGATPISTTGTTSTAIGSHMPGGGSCG